MHKNSSECHCLIPIYNGFCLPLHEVETIFGSQHNIKQMYRHELMLGPLFTI
jgi:hypothetical protein